MAGMYERGGTWYAKYYIDGRVYRKSLKTHSKQRARAKLVELEKAIDEGRPVNSKRDISFEDFAPKFETFLATGKRPHTSKTLLHEWGRFAKWTDAVMLADVRQEDVTQYREYLLAEGYAKSTVRSALLCLSSVFRAAINDLHVLRGVNPCKGVELPKADKRKPEYLNDKQIAKVLRVAEKHSDDMHLIYALGIFAGLRKNEIVNARWEWIGWRGQGQINVANGDTFQTKSGEPRTIPLNKRLREILKQHRRDDGYIVYPDVAPKTKAVDYRVDFTAAFDTVAKAAGVSWLTPHKLRHTFASALAIRNVSLYKIGQWLGHQDPKTTQIYAHLQAQDDAVNF